MAQPLDTSARALLLRLWRGQLAGHRRGIAIAIACTLGVAATTALYPVVIQQSFDRYTEGRHDWLWLVPMIFANCAMVVAASSALKSSQELPRSIMTWVKSDRCSVATPS